ncbi:MAG: Unknown protein [uncultured Aureispira sp.]|uniref:Uncharacterized protein n=1 Tax=uncultured Aureispira sp. TaxID=1331704 RepID=A0A6S6TU50_9BACT|nr:MAG: Unknown protein [uncultured Aureispira sp.]
MNTVGKVVSLNLLIFVLYTLLIHATSGNDAAIEGTVLAYMHAVGVFFIGIFMAIFNKGEARNIGAALVLSGLLIAVIGFSVCLGTLELNLH